MPTLNYRVNLDTADLQSQAMQVSQMVTSGLNMHGRLGTTTSSIQSFAPNTVHRDLAFVNQMLPMRAATDFMAPVQGSMAQASMPQLFGAMSGVSSVPPQQFAQFQGQKETQEFGRRVGNMAMTAAAYGPGMALDVASMFTGGAAIQGAGWLTGMLMSPMLPLTLGASAASYVGGEALQQQLGKNRITSSLRSRFGMSRTDAGVLADTALEFGADSPFTSAMGGLRQLNMAAHAGIIGRPEQSTEEMKAEFRKFQESVNTVVKHLKTTNQQAEGLLASMGSMGMEMQDAQSLIRRIGASGGTRGRGRAVQMMQAGMQAAQQVGVMPGVGAEMGVDAAGLARFMAKEGEIDRASLVRLGGTGGLAETLMQQQLNAVHSPVGQTLGLAMIDPRTGQLDRERFNRLRSGDLSLNDVNRMATARMSTNEGRNLATAMAADPAVFAREIAQATREGFKQAVREVSQEHGMNETQAAMLLGRQGAFGLQGAQAGLAFYRGAQNYEDFITRQANETRRAQNREIIDEAMRRGGLFHRMGQWTQENLITPTRGVLGAIGRNVSTTANVMSFGAQAFAEEYLNFGPMTDRTQALQGLEQMKGISPELRRLLRNRIKNRAFGEFGDESFEPGGEGGFTEAQLGTGNANSIREQIRLASARNDTEVLDDLKSRLLTASRKAGVHIPGSRIISYMSESFEGGSWWNPAGKLADWRTARNQRLIAAELDSTNFSQEAASTEEDVDVVALGRRAFVASNLKQEDLSPSQRSAILSAINKGEVDNLPDRLRGIANRVANEAGDLTGTRARRFTAQADLTTLKRAGASLGLSPKTLRSKNLAAVRSGAAKEGFIKSTNEVTPDTLGNTLHSFLTAKDTSELDIIASGVDETGFYAREGERLLSDLDKLASKSLFLDPKADARYRKVLEAAKAVSERTGQYSEALEPLGAMSPVMFEGKGDAMQSLKETILRSAKRSPSRTQENKGEGSSVSGGVSTTRVSDEQFTEVKTLLAKIANKGFFG